ncbi:hypothetical protein GCM10009841_08140 [Microlunatus panaciterrae]
MPCRMNPGQASAIWATRSMYSGRSANVEITGSSTTVGSHLGTGAGVATDGHQPVGQGQGGQDDDECGYCEGESGSVCPVSAVTGKVVASPTGMRNVSRVRTAEGENAIGYQR